MAPETVLITGASGLIGQALLDQFDCEVIALAHRAELESAPRRTVVQADVTQPRFGLPESEFDELARRADAIVHCAALTDYAATFETASKVNVEGVKHTLELVERADAPLYHLSSAFVVTPIPDRESERIGPQIYLKTKRAGEELVNSSGLDTMIVRPSLLLGDSQTGWAARFQGVHMLIQFLFQESVAMIPLDGDSRVDLVAQDQVAAAIAGLVKSGIRGGLWWLTAGEESLTADRLLDIAIEEAWERGVDVPRPRLVDPEVVERLFRPALLPDFPPKVRRRFEQLLELMTVFFTDYVFPSSFEQIRDETGAAVHVDGEQAFRNTIAYWADLKGYRRERHEIS